MSTLASCTVCLTFGWLVLRAGSASASETFVLIRNSENPTSTLSQKQLRAMAVGEVKEWDQAGPLQWVVLEEPGADIEWLAREVFGIPAAALRRKMKLEVFRGELRPPRTASSEAEVIDKVRHNRGALALVSSETSKALPEGVATIQLTD
ncbi:MAG: hypothetical protein ACOZIN_01540 [Myxococcota bacterium]